ncbi:hypothetical protein Tco_1256584 [Tanacetum coccineum]
MTKVDIPKFSGDDVKGWIFRCEQLFSIDEIPKIQKVKLIYVNLFDNALLWHRRFIKLNGENVSWNVYKNGILQRFGTVYDDPDFEWQLQGETYIDMMILPLGGCEMVLGIQWSTTLGDIKCNFVPIELPPQRTHDQRISLLTNTQQVNIRPYRYLPIQKDAIEVMVKEPFDSGVIKPSNSPFASPIVMVKKKDNT